MAFRAVKADTYAAIRSRATQLKKFATDSKALMLAGPVSASAIRQLLDLFIQGKAELQTASGVSGIVEYAKAQEGDAAYDVAAEFTAMLSACTGVIDWIVANVPTNSGYVLTEQWSASGVTLRTFSTSQTAGLRTTLDTFIATVN